MRTVLASRLVGCSWWLNGSIVIGLAVSALPTHTILLHEVLSLRILRGVIVPRRSPIILQRRYGFPREAGSVTAVDL